MPKTTRKYPHYRLEEQPSGLPVRQTTAGYSYAKAKDADTYPTFLDALIAAGSQPVEPVRVDA